MLSREIKSFTSVNMKEILGQWPRIVVVSLICVVVMALYCYVLTINDIIPLEKKYGMYGLGQAA